MKESATLNYVPTPRVRRLAMGAAVACLAFLMAAAGYGLYLSQSTPTVPDESVPLDPEETVLFYQPDEYQDLVPLADCPTELDYLDSTRYLA